MFKLVAIKKNRTLKINVKMKKIIFIALIALNFQVNAQNYKVKP